MSMKSNSPKKLGLPIFLGSIALIGVVVSAALMKNSGRLLNANGVYGDTSDYTVVLDSSNKYTSGTTKEVTTSSGQWSISFEYTNVSALSNGHVTLADGGKLVNTREFISIDYLKIHCDGAGTLRFRTSYDGATWGGYATVSDNEIYNLASNPYYIELTATGGSVNIYKATYQYTCVANPSAEGTQIEIPGETTWDLVTDESELSTGDEFVIVGSDYAGKYYAMNNATLSAEYYLSCTSITVSDNVASVTSSHSVWTLGGTSGAYTLKCGDNYLLGKQVAGSSKTYYNTGLTEDFDSTICNFDISFDGSNAILKSASNVYICYQYYNKTAEFFGKSTDAGTTYLFKKNVVSGGSYIEYDTPVDEIGFTAVDTNASGVYTADSIYSTDKGLVVKAKFTDGSQTVLSESTDYTYKVTETNSIEGEPIDKTAKFGKAGTFYVVVTYKDYLPQILPIQVSLPAASITAIEAKMTTKAFTTADVVQLTDNLSCDVTSTDYYSQSSTTNVAYANFASNGLTVTLIDPNGVAKSISTAFGVAGTWTLRVTHTATSLQSNISLTVSAVPVTDISIDNVSPVEIYVGKTATLTITVTPSTATNKDVIWTSSDEDVATVSDGVVTGVSVGSATITATSADNSSIYGTCTVNVSAPTTPDTWELVTNQDTLVAGDQLVIASNTKGKTAGPISTGSSPYLTQVNSTFSDDSYNTITSLNEDTIIFTLGGSEGAWTLENADGEKLGATAVKKLAFGSGTTTWSISIGGGDATIQNATSTYGYFLHNYNNGTERFTTYTSTGSNMTKPQLYRGKTSTPVYPTSISLSGNQNIGINETTTFGVTYNPAGTNQKVFKFTSSDTDVATVTNEGVVTGVSEGTATITAFAKASATDTVGKITTTRTVTVSRVAVTGITLSPTALSLSVGNQSQIVPTVLPSNATNKAVNWQSSNTSVATVTDGVVRGVATGSATITATTVDGSKSATCSVTVSEAPSLSKTSLQYTYDDYTSNNYYDLDNCPLSGSPKLLIIPVWFTDSTTFINTSSRENVRNDIEKAYLGTTTDTGWNSVKSFYTTESANRMNLTGTVTSWYECGMASSSFYTDDTGADNTNSLVTTATNWYFSNNTSDNRRNYDSNGDGHLDGVMLIYAAPDYSAWGKSESSYGNMWAYCYWLQGGDASTSSPTPNVFFWASYDFMYSSSTASSRTGKSSYNGGDTSHCSVDAHTYIHEMGHVLGLDDYYDYSNSYNPAGGFSMQDFNVGGHDAYSVMAYGWADPYIPTETMDITINDFQSSHDVILLSNHNSTIKNTNKSPFDEYLLLELYSPTGLNEFDCTYQYSGSYPKGPNTVGIRLWHVDARLTYRSNNKWSTTFTTNPTRGNVETAMVNSYSGNYASDLGSSYYNYNLLQLIRNSTSETYKPTSDLTANSLFRAGATYTQSTYSGQFVNSTNMNDGAALGWSFTVKSISGNSAVITVTKL